MSGFCPRLCRRSSKDVSLFELIYHATANDNLIALFVNTHAIAAHFSFRTQHELYDTDLLSRYRAYANEMICTKDNQIRIPKAEP